METAASIIAVVQLCETVIKYIIAVSGAKHEKQRLRTQIRDCSSLLNKLQDETDDPENAEEWDRILKLLSTPLAHLQDALSLAAAALSPRDGLRENLRWPFKEKDVEKMIGAIESGMSMVTLALNYTTTSLLVKISACSKRNEKHLADLKSALDSRIRETHLTLRSINGELESIQTTQNDVRGRVEELHGRQDTEEALRKRQRILDWLTPIDHASEQRDAISRRQKGTGEWLLRSQTYQDWLSTDSRTLFCPGIPGAGKTVFASIINADLWERYQDDPTVGLAHLFCNYRRHNEQTLEALLSGLLKQLVQHQVPLPECVTSLHDTQQRGASNRIQATTEALKSVIATYSRVFIVLDALDECSTSHGCRTQLLSSVQSLQKQCHINLLATSRFIPEITEKFKTACQLEIQADSDDVRRYLSDNITRLPGFVQDNTGLREEVVSKIVEAVRGMFLLAKLHLDSLIGKRSAKRVKLALNELATGSDAYDSAYDAAMRRIESQVTDQVELAKQALAFLTCARRPLSTDELREALGVEAGDSELDPDNYPDIEDILASCLGLIAVDEDSGIIRLVHYTTQEYLERTLDRWSPDAQATITSVCVSYLSLDRYADPNNLHPSGDSDWYVYCASNWKHHARLAPSCLALVVKFLLRQVNVIKSSLHAREHYTPADCYAELCGMPPLRWTTGLHVAIASRLEAATVALLKQGPDLHARNRTGHTPLMMAVYYSHEVIPEILLKDDSCIDATSDGSSQTALHLASIRGEDNVVKMLIEHGATIDPRDAGNATPLHLAILEGHIKVVKTLLDARADTTTSLWSSRLKGMHSAWDIGLRRTNLTTAVWNSCPDMVKLLLEYGVDVNEREERSLATALFYAVRVKDTSFFFDAAPAQETMEVIQILLEAGADPNIPTCDGYTPLHNACSLDNENGGMAMIKTLLDAGANCNLQNEEGYTAYQEALIWEKDKIAQYLLDRGADPQLGLPYRPDSPIQSKYSLITKRTQRRYWEGNGVEV